MTIIKNFTGKTRYRIKMTAKIISLLLVILVTVRLHYIYPMLQISQIGSSLLSTIAAILACVQFKKEHTIAQKQKLIENEDHSEKYSGLKQYALKRQKVGRLHKLENERYAMVVNVVSCVVAAEIINVISIFI